MVNSVRSAVLSALYAMKKESAYSEQLLKNTLRTSRFDARDAALFTRLFYGVQQQRDRLDFYICHYSGKKKKQMPPAVLDILRLAFYQIVFLTRIPRHAVLHEAAMLAKSRAGAKSAGFVNAVLRKVPEDITLFPEIPGKGTALYLSVYYSHPLWFVEKMAARLGYDGAARLLALNNQEAPVTCRVNTIQTDTDGALSALREEGVTADPFPGMEGFLTLRETGDVGRLSAYQSGMITVQDPAAGLPALVLAPKPGERVIDLCAAPGGKTMQMAAMMENTGAICAFDLYPHKIDLTQKNACRMGVTIVRASVSDATRFEERLCGTADKILCDVPCSGSGIIRKKPEIRYKPEAELTALPEIQLKILKNAAKYLRIGGEMVYSTCSVFEEENEQVVKAFLAETENYSLVPFSVPDFGEEASGMITLYPHIHGMDGFFIAKLYRHA